MARAASQPQEPSALVPLLCEHDPAGGGQCQSQPPHVAYETALGRMLHGLSEEALQSDLLSECRGQVQLVFTSPPFALNRKKKYGNETGDQYVEWLCKFARPLRDLLTPRGSIVIEMGNAWEAGSPVMSTLALKALLAFLDAGDFKLCQQFVCYNPARLPAPAQWVNVERIRVKDAYTHLWWMARTARPKASNRRVLTKYSPAMRTLLRTKNYNAGKRPSEYQIGEKSFLKDNGGAIPSNVLTYSNTRAHDPYQRFCKGRGLDLHPARMPIELAEFFIKFLTTKRDLVFDPFAGTNTTGSAAQALGRRWLSVEAGADYVAGSRGRFLASASRS